VPSVLKLERRRGRGESHPGCDQQPCGKHDMKQNYTPDYIRKSRYRLFIFPRNLSLAHILTLSV